MLKKLILSGVLALGLVLAVAGTHQVQAGLLENAYLSLSDPRTAQTGVTHDFYFNVINTTLGSVRIQYCVLPSGTCSFPSGGGASGTLGTYTEAGGAPTQTFTASWEAGSTRWNVAAPTAETTVAGNTWRFQFTSSVNPTYTDCTHNPPSNSSTGTCYVRIYVYSATNFTGTPDETIVSLTVTQAVTVSARVDPTFTFTVEGTTGDGSTAANTTTLTNAITTTVTTIPFGNLTANTEKFAAHVLTVTTNTVGGYTIAARMTANLTGKAYADDIDPFAAAGVNSTTPQSWSIPTGTVSGTNTGWLGVGTDDTGVTGQAANKFFPLNTTDFVVAKSPNSASTRISKIVYGIEVNAFQEADNYTGTLLYTATPVY
jgi:hypothetical protein